MYLASGTGGFQKLCFKTPLYRGPFQTPVGYDLKNPISTLCSETYVKDWISKAEYFLPLFFSISLKLFSIRERGLVLHWSYKVSTCIISPYLKP